MCQFEGMEILMECLHGDIRDVQWIINDISSHVGPIETASWKFPNKKSWELDIDALLEMYGYYQTIGEGEEDQTDANHLAHMALYELLIDRLLLLVQGTVLFLNKSHVINRTIEVIPPLSFSVGLAVKQFWARVTDMKSTMMQIMSENDFNKRKLDEICKETAASLFSHGSNCSLTAAITFPPCASSPCRAISSDNNGKASQTVETAFVPCESCNVVQSRIKESGDMIIDVCQRLGLPSTLRGYKPLVADSDWMSLNDVTRWMADQNRDVQRLCKHADRMSGSLEPLQAQVEAFEKETKELERKFKQSQTELKRERETQATVRDQFEVRLADADRCFKVKLTHVLHQNQELLHQKEELLRSKRELVAGRCAEEREMLELKSRLSSAEDKFRELEGDLTERCDRLDTLGGREARHEQELSEMRDLLDSTSKALSKERNKNKSAMLHYEQVQLKQVSLSERVTELDSEAGELRDHVHRLEEEKGDVQTLLHEVKQQSRRMEKEAVEREAVLSSKTDENSRLDHALTEAREQSSVLEQNLMEEREQKRLVMEFPDLNGPVNPDMKGGGDVAEEMRNQVEANIVRIQVLEGQNNKLHRTISKLAVCRRQEAGCSRGNGRSEEEVGEPSADWLVQKVVELKLQPQRVTLQPPRAGFYTTFYTDCGRG